jgi:hypothetical protein
LRRYRALAVLLYGLRQIHALVTLGLGHGGWKLLTGIITSLVAESRMCHLEKKMVMPPTAAIREILNLWRTRQFSPARREIGADLLFLR